MSVPQSFDIGFLCLILGFAFTSCILTGCVVAIDHPNGPGGDDVSGGGSHLGDGETANGQGFTVVASRFQLGGHPFVPLQDWKYGPGDHVGNYGTPKKFFPFVRSDGREGVIWQDMDQFTVHATWFTSDMTSAETTTIYSGTRLQLQAAAFGGNDEVILLLVSPQDGSSTGELNFVKVNCMSSDTVKTRSMDSGANVFNLQKGSNSGASMVWNTQSGVVGVILARGMWNGHQGAVGFVLDANSFDILVNPWQTSGHSFANSLVLASDGTFISMDFGDNYPRGIHLWRFDTSSKSNFLPYAIKTHHATAPRNTRDPGHTENHPVYPEISTGGTTYYKWSNDNYIYGELGHTGVVEVSDGLLIFFSGERPALDNTKVGKLVNSARNLGFVKVGKDLSRKEVLSSGPIEKGGFYGYGGNWQDQEHKGINWLTDFTSVDDLVSRLKTAQLGGGKILIYWEVWSERAYKYTQMMVVDSSGARLQGPWSMDSGLSLPIQDDLFIKQNQAVAFAGASGGFLMRYEISFDPR